MPEVGTGGQTLPAAATVIATRYLQNLDTINPQAIINSEDGQKLNARLEPNGRISIEHPKFGRVLWSAAVSAGLFKPHFFKR